MVKDFFDILKWNWKENGGIRKGATSEFGCEFSVEQISWHFRWILPIIHPIHFRVFFCSLRHAQHPIIFFVLRKRKQQQL